MVALGPKTGASVVGLAVATLGNGANRIVRVNVNVRDVENGEGCSRLEGGEQCEGAQD